MKLKLEKQNVTTLSSKDMGNINGGGEKWSDFRTGNCNYSRTEGQGVLVCQHDDANGNTMPDILVGCKVAEK